jgi:hypothetical protein
MTGSAARTVNDAAMDFRELLSRLRRRPGMFGVTTFGELAAFVNGCDAATNGMLLEGFHEWLQMRIGRHSSLTWPAIVAEMSAPDREGKDPVELSAEEFERVCGCACDLLDEFLRLRGTRNGLKRIHNDFHRWERLRSELIRSSEGSPSVRLSHE